MSPLYTWGQSKMVRWRKSLGTIIEPSEKTSDSIISTIQGSRGKGIDLTMTRQAEQSPFKRRLKKGSIETDSNSLL